MTMVTKIRSKPYLLCDDLADVLDEMNRWQQNVQDLLPDELFERMRQVLARAKKVR